MIDKREKRAEKANQNSPSGVEGKHFVDISTWKRREHFEVFNAFDEPLFGVVVRLECSAARKVAKEKGYRNSLSLIHI